MQTKDSFLWYRKNKLLRRKRSDFESIDQKMLDNLTVLLHFSVSPFLSTLSVDECFFFRTHPGAKYTEEEIEPVLRLHRKTGPEI